MVRNRTVKTFLCPQQAETETTFSKLFFRIKIHHRGDCNKKMCIFAVESLKRHNMKKTLLILIALTITTLTGCRDSAHVNEIFLQADSLMADHPDSAYTMLLAMEPEVQACLKGQQMRYELLRAKAQNKAFVDFTTDSIMLLVADYYDHHGTPNDRLMAHYLLGCTYRDLGEAPRAIDSYHTAVESADTTDSECDYATLGCVYSQMAKMYYKQLLYTNEIECRTLSCNYAKMTGDNEEIAYELSMIGGTYIQLNQIDSAETYLYRAKQEYIKNNLYQEWLTRSLMLMHLYLENNIKVDTAKKLIENFEKESDIFNENHELPLSKWNYYGYKGKIYENLGQLDSAEYCYRKIGMIQKDPMYRGLLRVYQQHHNADSIAKYALLYCEANDSSIAITDRELTAKMAASYNYNRYLKEANVQQARAARTTLWLVITIAITLFIIIGALLIIKNYRRRRIEKQRELDCLMQEYADTCEALSIKHNEMEEQKLHDKTLIAVLEETLEHAKSETEQQKTKTEELKKEIEVLREQYEENLQTHSEKYEQLQSKLSILIQHGAIQRIENKAKSFVDSATARRITNIAFDVHECVTEQEWEDITHHAQTHYPELMHDLSAHADISKQAVRVAVLVLLAIPPAGMANIMKVGLQRITNIKSEINMAIFNDKSARTLLANIGKKYAVYPKPM